MNYGKNGIAKKQKELTSKGTMIRKKFVVILLKVFFILLITGGVCGTCMLVGIFQGVVDSAPDIHEIDATPTGYLSTVLDANGNEIASLVASGSNRVYVTIDEIPEDLQHAFVAIEDSRFYEHNGIDAKGILRAAFVGLSHGGHFSEGASTITQQLLKNNVFTGWTTQTALADKLERKIQEQYLALQLEKIQSKSWILENYLNTINLGQNTLGVQAASKRYFQKDVSDLTLSECAVIAGITQNPSKYNPVSNPKENAKRRKKVLKNMKEFGYITSKQYEKALDDDVYSRIQLVNSSLSEGNSVTSYFVDAVTDQVVQDLIAKKGYTETQAYKVLYNGGLTIYSTEDPKIQSICDAEVNNPDNYGTAAEYSFTYQVSVKKADGTVENYNDQSLLAYFRAMDPNFLLHFSSVEEATAVIDQYRSAIVQDGDSIVKNSEQINYTIQPQTALTVIDQATGEVKAIVGGRGDKTGSKTLSRATDTTRQPGSTFKVLAAYAPAIDAGGMTLATVEDDAPFAYSNGQPLKNYDHHYHGFTTLREAITSSINVVTVKAFSDLGTDVGFSYLQNFGITTLKDSDNVQSLCLGGITDGVTNLELTAAYATIANSGTYTAPRFYTKILDHDGNVLIDNTPDTHTVLKETTAFLLTNAMQDVVTIGTGKLAAFDGMPIAGKTGTTSKNHDALFAGYTPYYTCVVWGGYDDNTSLSSTAYPKLVWKAVMSRIHEGLEYRDFQVPDGIVACDICKKSGKLAVNGLCDCDPRGSMVRTEYFASGTEPTEACDHHISATICSESGMLANEFCPPELLATKVYIVGGSPDTDDGPYLYDNSEQLCNIHTDAFIHMQELINDGEDPEDDSNIVPDETGNSDSQDHSKKKNSKKKDSKKKKKKHKAQDE